MARKQPKKLAVNVAKRALTCVPDSALAGVSGGLSCPVPLPSPPPTRESL